MKTIEIELKDEYAPQVIDLLARRAALRAILHPPASDVKGESKPEWCANVPAGQEDGGEGIRFAIQRIEERVAFLINQSLTEHHR